MYYFCCHSNMYSQEVRGDVHPNPGACHGNTFKFCQWNLDSTAVNAFIKIPLIEMHNSVYNDDIITLRHILTAQ